MQVGQSKEQPEEKEMVQSDLARGCGQSRETVGTVLGWERAHSTHSNYNMEVLFFMGSSRPCKRSLATQGLVL